jgi:hypothetical protein
LVLAVGLDVVDPVAARELLHQGIEPPKAVLRRQPSASPGQGLIAQRRRGRCPLQNSADSSVAGRRRRWRPWSKALDNRVALALAGHWTPLWVSVHPLGFTKQQSDPPPG